ncbi:MAG: hypothetical protein IJX90_12170 [Blautia sp.]|nr:hypothetical protein [Blautia sp.]
MEWWKRELQGLYEAFMKDDREIEFSEYIEQHASPRFLAMAAAEHNRLEALHARGIRE